MNTKVYVGGLPYSTSDEELKNHFSSAGEVTSVVIITDKMTNQSRGFGFVEFANSSDAQKAIEMFDQKDFGGRKLFVSEARSKTEQ